MSGIFIVVMFIAPILVGYYLAESRNRNVVKGCFVGFLTGWLGIFAMYMALKTKVEKKDGSVYYK